MLQAEARKSTTEANTRPRRLPCADLLRRVSATDALECPRCGDLMRVIAAIHPPEATAAILGCLDLPSRAPPLAGPGEDDTEAGMNWDLAFESDF